MGTRTREPWSYHTIVSFITVDQSDIHGKYWANDEQHRYRFGVFPAWELCWYYWHGTLYSHDHAH